MRPLNLPYALRVICEFRSEGGKPRGRVGGRERKSQRAGQQFYDLEPKWRRLKISKPQDLHNYDPERVRQTRPELTRPPPRGRDWGAGGEIVISTIFVLICFLQQFQAPRPTRVSTHPPS